MRRAKGIHKCRRHERRIGRALVAMSVAAASVVVAAKGQAVHAVDRSDFVGQKPTRLLDSRNPGSIGRVARGGEFELSVGTTGPVAVNLTAVLPTFSGWIAAFPCKAGFAGTSNVNFDPGNTVANFVIVQPDSDGMLCFKTGGASAGSLDVVVDRYGNFIGSDFATQQPNRLFDSRASGGKIRARGVKVLGGFEPNSTQILNLTVEGPEAAGYLTVYPCDQGRPTTSASNYEAGLTRAALTFATADRKGNVCVFTLHRTSLIVDKFGEMQGGAVDLNTARRLMDTRIGKGGSSGRQFKLRFREWGGRSVAMTITSVDSANPGFVVVYPCSGSVPETSIVNYEGAPANPNLVVVVPDQNGEVCFDSSQLTNLVVDHYGYLGTKVIEPTAMEGCYEVLDYSAINEWRAAVGERSLVDYPDSTLLDKGCKQLAYIIDNGGTLVHTQQLPSGTGENLAYLYGSCAQQATIDRAMQMWRNSPGHYENGIRSQFRYVGLTCMQRSDGRAYLATWFASGLI